MISAVTPRLLDAPEGLTQFVRTAAAFDLGGVRSDGGVHGTPITERVSFQLERAVLDSVLCCIVSALALALVRLYSV